MINKKIKITFRGEGGYRLQLDELYFWFSEEEILDLSGSVIEAVIKRRRNKIVLENWNKDHPDKSIDDKLHEKFHELTEILKSIESSDPRYQEIWDKRAEVRRKLLKLVG